MSRECGSYPSEHKTGKQGPTRLTLTEEKHKLDLYVQYVRPACDPLGDHDKLLSLPRGHPLVDLNKLLKKNSKAYNINIPTVTRLRKDVVTKATLECSSAEVALLSWRMSHSTDTHRRSYEEIGTAAYAAKASKLVQQLTEPEPPPKPKKMFWTTPQVSLIEDFFNPFMGGAKLCHIHWAGLLLLIFSSA